MGWRAEEGRDSGSAPLMTELWLSPDLTCITSVYYIGRVFLTALLLLFGFAILVLVFEIISSSSTFSQFFIGVY